MCPGGYVVNSSSEEGYLNINGMSYSLRNSGVANSAIIVSVNEKDYGMKPLDGIKFQEELERKAYNTGKGFIPVQTYKDFKNNQITKTSLNELKIKGKYNYGNLNDIFPKYICDDLKEAIDYFNNKIKGFANIIKPNVIGTDNNKSTFALLVINSLKLDLSSLFINDVSLGNKIPVIAVSKLKTICPNFVLAA